MAVTRPSPIVRIVNVGGDHRHVVLKNADEDAADDVDERDQNGSHRVALGESNGSIHGAVEFGFLADLLPARAGFFLIDDSSVKVGVDRKLFARHRIQREAGRHFRNTHRAVVDHDVLDHDQDQKNDDADRVIPSHDELTECANHIARCRRLRSGESGGSMRCSAKGGTTWSSEESMGTTRTEPGSANRPRKEE